MRGCVCTNLVAQTGVCGEIAALGYPAGDGAGVDGQAETAADVVSRAVYGVALVEAAEGLQDDLEWVGVGSQRIVDIVSVETDY